MPAKITPGHVGDWLDVSSPGGGSPRRGQILEVLGAPHHEHYLVSWTDGHQSIHYPSDGTHIMPQHAAAASEPPDATT